LHPFSADDLTSVCRAFERAPICELQQAWLPTPDPCFAPGTVRVGWRENTLFVYAELPDADVFTGASALNQRLWELGDAFEIFLKTESQESYVELQVAPTNHRLQLRYADRTALEDARRSGDLSGALIPGEAFHSRTWVQEAPSRWNVLAEIPASLVTGPNARLDVRWQSSFGRYDYTRGHARPVISSTSPHSEADFHRQHEWGWLEFEQR
jgi:hypothetical protein